MGSTPPHMVRVHVFVSGIVQRVGFRYYTARKAKALGITGFVKNLPDGRVEIVAEGSREAINKFIEEVSIGPPRSKVDGMEIFWEDFSGEFSDFKVVKTGRFSHLS